MQINYVPNKLDVRHSVPVDHAYTEISHIPAAALLSVSRHPGSPFLAFTVMTVEYTRKNDKS